jgi:hypothetical protein
MTVLPYQRTLLVLVLVGHSLWPDCAAIAISPKSSHGAGPVGTQASVGEQRAPRQAARSITKRERKKQPGERPNIGESPNRKALDSTRARPAQPKKVGKKLRPLASVQPKPDLSYHGMLEQPRRYDPGRARKQGTLPNPQAGDLLHDHFQELDKNRDGMIDPFERTLGRLDIERDLTNRHWK